MKKLIYSLKILAATIAMYCCDGSASAKGAAEQAKLIVEEVDKMCGMEKRK
jgi:hypothetical protein